MTKILGLSGKKQSGKNTSANFIVGIYMRGLGLVRDHIQMQPDGRFSVSDILGDTDLAGIFDITRRNESMLTFLEEYIHPYVKLYSCADLLKELVCIDILGLTYEQCYGTDKEKNEETHLRWEDMPGVMTPGQIFSLINNSRDDLNNKGLPYGQPLDQGRGPDKNGRWISSFDNDGIRCQEPGQMTAREVMQYVGTEIFRKMYGNVWIDSLIRRIEREDTHLAIVTDVRFPNEVEGIQKAEGKVIRLLRDPSDGKDQHDSETALDDYPLERTEKTNYVGFDAYIDNKEMDIDEQCIATRLICAKWENFVPEHISEKQLTL